jgi:DnaJ-class molecular chaperone
MDDDRVCCPRCNGDGDDPIDEGGEWVNCALCGGDGVVQPDDIALFDTAEDAE